MSRKTTTLRGRIEERIATIEWEFLSRWRFERLLDELAELVRAHLAEKVGARVECSILYRLDEDLYILGGASVNRLEMDRSASHYDLALPAGRESVTGTALRYGATLVLDDFPDAVARQVFGMRHVSKKCELDHSETMSFLAIPAFRQKPPPPLHEVYEQMSSDGRPRSHAGLLRLTFSHRDLATPGAKALPANALRRIFWAVDKGGAAVRTNRGKHALALADLHSDLLRYRSREYEGLMQLAFHLQTQFENCECSIFLAQKGGGRGAGLKEVFDLYLAATTALSDSPQHRTFLDRFLTGDKHYSCTFAAPNVPDQDAVGGAAKTERAFYFPSVPVVENENLGSVRFRGQGEVETPKQFLALAIPARTPGSYPYGVIRIVRYEDRRFDGHDRSLAAAIAQGMTYWLDFFPRNDALQVSFRDEEDRERLLKNLFDISPVGPEFAQQMISAEREFTWLLQKIFFQGKRVVIDRVFSGRSGAIVLLVKNDTGLDVILKCNRKPWRWRTENNEIWQEIENYWNYIEGKLELNHNIIYHELIRETVNLIGFATSFIHSANSARISISDACQREGWRSNLPALGWTLTRVVEKLITDVWAWWYQPAQVGPPKRGKPSELLERMGEDPLFGFLQDMEKFDRRVRGELRRIDGLRKEFGPSGNLPAPSVLWRRFVEHTRAVEGRVSWRETVTHGDTHGDNLFFDPTSLEIWVIDFARTGRRPDIFDLALLEADLKFKQLPNILGPHGDDVVVARSFVEAFKRFEQTLASQRSYEEVLLPLIVVDEPRPPWAEALAMVAKVVVDIRQLACQSLRRSGAFTDYQMAQMLLAFKYMKLGEVSPARRLLPYLSARELVDARFRS